VVPLLPLLEPEAIELGEAGAEAPLLKLEVPAVASAVGLAVFGAAEASGDPGVPGPALGAVSPVRPAVLSTVLASELDPADDVESPTRPSEARVVLANELDPAVFDLKAGELAE
jgi:hypothetical protein